MNEKLKRLHENLTQKWDGFSVSFEQFEKDMQDESKRRSLHENLTQKWDGFNLGFEEFSNDITPKKKDDSGLSGSDVSTDGDLGEGWTVEKIDALDRGDLSKLPSLVLRKYHSKTISDSDSDEWNWYDYLNPLGPKHDREFDANRARLDISLAEKREQQKASVDETIQERVADKIEGKQTKVGSVLGNVSQTTDNIFTTLGATLGDALNEFDQFIAGLSPHTDDSDLAQRQAVHDQTMKKMGRRLDSNNQEMQANTIVRSWDTNKTWDENVEVANQGIVETFEKDGAVAGFGEVGIKVAESIPYLALSFLTGGAGVGATGGAFFSTGYGDSLLEQYNENPENIDRGKAGLHGVVEGGASILLGGVSKVGRETLKSVGKEEAKKILSNNVSNYLRQSLAAGAKTGLAEGFEEAIQEVSHYGIDVLYGDAEWDRDRAMTMAIDSFILGAASGGPVGTASNYASYIRAKNISESEVFSINEELQTQSSKDNPKKAKYLRERRSEIYSEIDIDPADIDGETKSEIDDAYFEIKNKEVIIAQTQDKSLRDGLIKERDALKSKLDGIINDIDGRSEKNGESKGDDDGSEPEIADDDEQAGSKDGKGELQRKSDQKISEDLDFDPEDIQKFKDETRVDIPFMDRKKLNETNTNIDGSQIFGEEFGEVSVNKAHQELVKRGKKYEAVLNCMG